MSRLLFAAVVAFLIGLGVGLVVRYGVPEVFRAAELHQAQARADALTVVVADYEMQVRSAYHASSGQAVCPVSDTR